jgi:hypothetical protein
VLRHSKAVAAPGWSPSLTITVAEVPNTGPCPWQASLVTQANVEDLGAPVDDEIGEITDLIAVLRTLDTVRAPWFRGQTDQAWTLTPSAFRDRDAKDSEANMLLRFRQEASRLAPQGIMNNWDWLVLAQHHGLPTRLLDWSTNPLVGLFFASANGDEKTDGRFFCLDPEKLNARTRSDASQVMMLGQDRELQEYDPLGEAGKSKHEPLAVIAPKSFGRITQQAGVFTISHPTSPLAWDAEDDGAVKSWRIPLKAKETIRQDLKALRIDQATLFDDLASWSKQIKDEYIRSKA